MTYLLRPVRNGTLIAKFDDYAEPTSTYVVTTNSCSCPQGRAASCKHRLLLQRWISDGKPIRAYDNEESFDLSYLGE